jgi:beta-lactam-binding protein with PASTA domain
MNSGYVVGDICRIHHGQENSLEIIDQGPSSNESRAEDVPIQLLLNLGAPEEGYLMPDFVGRDVNEAIQLFEKNRIRIETVSYRQNTGFVKGLVLAQLPERGHYLSRGTEVRFEVSR